MTAPVLLVEKKDGIATLTLNRPDQMNALSAELLRALADEIGRLRTDREIGVVILTGAGRGFCAGLDLKEMGSREGREKREAGGTPAANARASKRQETAPSDIRTSTAEGS